MSKRTRKNRRTRPVSPPPKNRRTPVQEVVTVATRWFETAEGQLRWAFGRSVNWVDMDPSAARNMASVLLQYADSRSPVRPAGPPELRLVKS
jgi:hypothetical protein